RPSKITSCASTLCPGWLCLHSKTSPSRRGKPPDAQVGNSAFARTHHRLSASTVHSRSILQKGGEIARRRAMLHRSSCGSQVRVLVRPRLIPLCFSPASKHRKAV